MYQDSQGLTHAQRLEMAEHIRKRVLETHAAAVLAIFVTSSTAKGLDQPFSDLEVTVVLRDGSDVPSKSYIYRGILVEIEYAQESKLLHDAR